MFGRDEGFYYRASGIDLTRTLDESFDTGWHMGWRLFAEQQRTAAVKTDFAVNGADFPANLVAQRGGYAGASAVFQDQHGLDPKGPASLDGASIGERDRSRRFSVRSRGARSDGIARARAAGGRAYGVGRRIGEPAHCAAAMVSGRLADHSRPEPGHGAERQRVLDGAGRVGKNDAGFRPTIFGDLGWVGDRTKLREVGRPMSGVGVGVSLLDGLFRFDVARGLYPRKQLRVDLYLESKF